MAENASRGEYLSPAIERESEEAYSLHAALHPESRRRGGGEIVVSASLQEELRREAGLLALCGDRLPDGERVLVGEQAERFASVFERAGRELRGAAERGGSGAAA